MHTTEKIQEAVSLICGDLAKDVDTSRFDGWSVKITGEMLTRRGAAWTAEITHRDMEGVVHMEQEGCGGCNDYFCYDAPSRDLLKHLKSEAALALPNFWEAEDSFILIVEELALMEKGASR